MLKVIVITKDNKFCRIGSTFDRSAWYSLKNYKTPPFKQGEGVEIKFEKEGSDNILTEAKVIAMAEETKKAEQPYSKSNATEKKEWRSKSPEESESIRKQAIGKMVAETLKAMDLKDHGIADVEKIIETLFKKYEELTK